MFHRHYWKSVRGDRLLKLITAASAVAISFEGISQGIMGVVTVAPEYGRRMGYTDENNNVTNPSLQGGIAAIYYLYVCSELPHLDAEIANTLQRSSVRSLLGGKLLGQPWENQGHLDGMPLVHDWSHPPSLRH